MADRFDHISRHVYELPSVLPHTRGTSFLKLRTAVTPRLIIRPAKLSDVNGLWAMDSNSRLSNWRLSLTPPTFEEYKALFEKYLQDFEAGLSLRFTVLIRTSSEIDAFQDTAARIMGSIGSSDFRGITSLFGASSFEVWGKGLATEALDGFMYLYWKAVPSPTSLNPSEDGEWEIFHKNLEPIDYCQAVTAPHNYRAIRVMEKMGFRPWRLTPPMYIPSKDMDLRALVLRLWRPNAAFPPLPEGNDLDRLDECANAMEKTQLF